jgi:thiamine-phosphate pyrophosphorylase
LFKIKGIHYPEKVRRATTSYPRHIQLSTSFHTFQDLIASPKVFDYVFLSPIFNSISKDGYNAGFDLEELKQVLENIGHHVIALGGVDENNLLITEELGFAGVAVLGAIWEDSNPVEKFKRIKKILDKTR